jgi:DNA-binding transcriptional ArsR family regulator
MLSTTVPKFKIIELLHFAGYGWIYCAMRPFVHPAPDQITLQGVLHALADPVRLAIVRRLADCGPFPASCTACTPSDMPKSTRTHHFQVLREAGLVRSEKRGAEVINAARLEDVEARFPGLLKAILQAADAAAPCGGGAGP